MLRECPVGRILREADHTYDVLAAHRYSENAGLEVLSYSRYLQTAFSVVAGEKARLMALADMDRQSKHDAAHGAQILKGAGRGSIR